MRIYLEDGGNEFSKESLEPSASRRDFVLLPEYGANACIHSARTEAQMVGLEEALERVQPV